MPAAAWKELEVTCIPPSERTHVFHSSGTTEHRPSRHFHHADSLAVYSRAATAGFAHRYPGAASRPVLWALTPSAEDAPRSSLAYMLGCLNRAFDANGSEFFGRTTPQGWAVDTDRWIKRLHDFSGTAQPVYLIGTAFSFVHALDDPAFQRGLPPLPPGSHIVETGGYKGRSREMPRTELHTELAARFAVPRGSVVTEYGMSELSSQAYSEPVGESDSPLVFRFPPWARALVVSPESGREVADGAVGILRIIDLANVWSALGIQTADLALRRGDAFELLGRLPEAEARGCSLLSVPRS
ncbi:MAG TPA: long-chain fatty acid--CoA ligase [Verrucomicrobiales bacterium]|nr:long-chain fatty acid--CoA ligase [Verrucomicrobiales bacterium]